MEKVTGIGGVFFRAKDPAALKRWYQQQLGVALTPADEEQRPWYQERGPTAWEPFPADTKYFPADRQWMINFRVSDLSAMVAQLEAAGVSVKVDPENYPYGRFARLHDPEGNAIELWQPEGEDT
jgi:glyoxylase I family protein